MAFERCEHSSEFGGREEYCLENKEDLDVYARMTLEALDRLIYAAPKSASFDELEQLAERDISFWNGGAKIGDWAWPLSETTLQLHHAMNKPYGTESYVVSDAWTALRPEVEGSLTTKYYFEVATGHPVEGVIDAYDFDQDCYVLRPMTEYDYRQIVERLVVAERHHALESRLIT